VRLVLFDVDGTLLSAHGAGRRALGGALIEVYGTAGPIDSYDFHGATDPQIVWDLLTAARLEPAEIAAGEAECYRCYAARLATELSDGRGIRLFPGVVELVDRLADEAGVLAGLLTGNLEAGARLKLGPSGLLPGFVSGPTAPMIGTARACPPSRPDARPSSWGGS
jgi:phosphoglycolate phosphatase-like HAD superfamily hydrolase